VNLLSESKDVSITLPSTPSNIYANYQQDIIIVDSTKLENCFIKHLEKLEKKKTWHTPIGILLTFVLTYFTTEFKDALGYNKNVWEAFFLFIAFLTFCWSVYAVNQARISISTSELIDEIKGIRENK